MTSTVPPPPLANTTSPAVVTTAPHHHNFFEKSQWTNWMNGAVESLGFDNPISLLSQLLSDHNTDQIIQVLEKLFQLEEEKTGSCN